MAQLTGTQICTLAKYWAQDADTTNPGVDTTIQLELLNDVLLKYTQDVQQWISVISATTSGLTFPANTPEVTTSATNIASIVSAHPSDSASANSLLTPKLDDVSVDWIFNAYNDAGSGTVTGNTTEFEHVAWEQVVGDTVKWRVYVFPALNRTRYLTIRAKIVVTLSALSGTPDISDRDARIVGRFLGYEIARLNRRDPAFCMGILAPIPKDMVDRYFGNNLGAGSSSEFIRDTGALGG